MKFKCYRCGKTIPHKTRWFIKEDLGIKYYIPEFGIDTSQCSLMDNELCCLECWERKYK